MSVFSRTINVTIVSPYCLSNSEVDRKQYILDDDREFYNEAEPVTTMCPLLPGQPVNILYVPVVFPVDGCCAGCEQLDCRTMNPDDKYLNPRPPPELKPRLRVKTSPPLLNQPDPSWRFDGSLSAFDDSSRVSIPQSSTASVRSERGRAPKAARSVSPPRSKGLKAAFRYLQGHSPARSAVDCRSARAGILHDDELTARQMRTGREGRSPVPRSTQENVLERPVDSGIDNRGGCGRFLQHPSFGSMSVPIQDRRIASKSRDASPKTHLTVDPPMRDDDVFVAGSGGSSLSRQSSKTSLAVSDHSTGSREGTTTPKPPSFMDKRLPTLPNSPSSVMDEAVRAIDTQYRSLDMEALCSRFSDFTTSDESTANDSPCEISRFSRWSTDVENLSPSSMVTSLSFNNDKQPSPTLFGPSQPATPRLSANAPGSPASAPGDSKSSYPSHPHPCLSLSSHFGMSGMSTDDWEIDCAERDPKRHAALFEAMQSWSNLEMLRSPVSPSAIILPENIGSWDDLDVSRNTATAYKTKKDSVDSQPQGQSSMVQEIMDELGYLESMIDTGV